MQRHHTPVEKGPWSTPWSQSSSGIKAICAISEKVAVRVDLEGFTKPSKTVRPISVVSSKPVRCDAKFFTVENQKRVETEKETHNVESSKGFESKKIETLLSKRQKETKKKTKRQEVEA